MRRLVVFSVDHPRLVLILTHVATLVFAVQFPRIRIAANPENMLEAVLDIC